MPITLTYGGTTAALSDRLLWTDEFAWSPVVQEVRYSITGALVRDIGSKRRGRPITLDGTTSKAWIERSVCNLIRGWADLPGIQLDLLLRGTTRTVAFDAARGGFEAVPLWRLADGEQTPQEVLLPIFRLLEV